MFNDIEMTGNENRENDYKSKLTRDKPQETSHRYIFLLFLPYFLCII